MPVKRFLTSLKAMKKTLPKNRQRYPRLTIRRLQIITRSLLYFRFCFHTKDIKTTFEKKTVGTSHEYKPLTAQARIVQKLFTEGSDVPVEQNFLIQLFGPLQSFDTLLPCGLDVMIRVTFTEPNRFFICDNDKKPKFKIKGNDKMYRSVRPPVTIFLKIYAKKLVSFYADARLFLRACLLKPEAEMKIVSQLQKNQLQIPYFGEVFKSYSVPLQSLQAEIDISLKVGSHSFFFHPHSHSGLLTRSFSLTFHNF